MDDGTCHLIYGAVSAYSHDDVHTIVFCLCGYLGGVAGILGNGYFIVKLLMVDVLGDESWYARLVRRAGNKVDYENGFLLHVLALIYII